MPQKYIIILSPFLTEYGTSVVMKNSLYDCIVFIGCVRPKPVMGSKENADSTHDVIELGMRRCNVVRPSLPAEMLRKSQVLAGSCIKCIRGLCQYGLGVYEKA